MAVLVHELVEIAEAALLVAADDARDGLLPFAVLVVTAADEEVRVRERRLVGAVLDVVDDAERVEVDAEILIEAVVECEEVAALEFRLELPAGLPHRVAVIPGLDHLGAGRVAPGLEDLDEPLLHVAHGDADGFRGGFDAGAVRRFGPRRRA
jgi:hypothetical protein